MAQTNIGVNHPLAQKLWSRKLFQEVTGDLGITKFIGEGQNNIIQHKTETSKSAGDQITFGLRMLLSGDGIQGDNTLEGNEEALSLYNDAVVLNQLRHATRSQGKMSETRVPWSVRQENKDGLADWWKERMETSIFNQLAGNSDQTDTRYTANNSAVAPSTGSATRLVVGGGETAEASLSATTTHAIDLADLDSCIAIAKVQSPRMRPVRVNGKNMYVAFLHPYQIRQMRAQTAAGGWYELHSDMIEGGKYQDNPILTGSEFVYNNTKPMVHGTVTYH
jgi:N4-gp56 family major capsid protein